VTETTSPATAQGDVSLIAIDDARTRLINAAIVSFAAKGFHGATTRDIAAAAGMSPAALYVHHKSKEELLYLISRIGHEVALSLLRDSVATSEDPVVQLVAATRAFTAWHATDHTRGYIVNYELAALSAEHYVEIVTIRRAIEAEMRQVVEAGVEQGVFVTSNSHMTALALLSLGVDVARWYRDEGAWSPADIANHYGDLALRIVGAQRIFADT
jgi:AcrR family transcriptional regulator